MPWTFDQKLDERLAKKASGLKQVKAPTGVKFKIEVKFDAKVEKAAMADPLLRKDFEDAAIDTIDRFVDFVGLKMKATDDLVVKYINENKLNDVEPAKKKMNQDIEQMRGSAQLFGVKQVEQAWTDLGKKKSEYLKYKIKIVITIGAAAAGLATSIAMMAAAPWSGGASAAFSIIGMVKAATTIAKEAVAAGMEVETAAKALRVQLKAVEVIWAKSKAAGHANELTGKLLEQFLGQSQPSIKGCLTEMDRCKKKLTGLELKNHDVAKKLQKAINDMPKIEEDFMKEAEKRLKKHPNPKAIGELPKIRMQFHKAIDSAENTIRSMSTGLVKGVERFGKAKVVVEDLNKRVITIAKFRGGAYTVLDNVLLLTDVALAPLSGSNLVGSMKELAINLAPVVAGLAIDRISKLALEGTVLE